MEGYDHWKTTDHQFERDVAYSERLDAIMKDKEADPVEVLEILADYSSAQIDACDALEAKAHLSGKDEDWAAFVAERKRLFAAELLRRSKLIADREEYDIRQRGFDWLAAKTGEAG